MAKFTEDGTTKSTQSVVSKPESSTGDVDPFAIQVTGKSFEVLSEFSPIITPKIKSYRIFLNVPLVVTNLLTIPLTIVVTGKIQTEIQLQPGLYSNLNIEPKGYYKTEYKFLAKVRTL